jgi:hypothetical protein
MRPTPLLRSLLLIVCGSVASALPSGRADAAGQQICEFYVQRMKALSEKARYYKCGFWEQFNADTSRRWCLRVKNETVSQFRISDQQKMDKCAACRAYADSADAAARDNVLFRCGFTGSRWLPGDGSSNEPHFTWCMGLETEVTGFGVGYAYELPALVPFNHVTEERGVRNQALEVCKAKIPERFSKLEIQQCEDYAKKAVKDAKVNEEKKCGATLPGRWSQNEQDHFMWCLPKIGDPDGKKEVESEERIRDRGVDACQRGKTLNAEGIPPPVRLGKSPLTIGKKRPGSGGINKSIAGKTLAGDKKGGAMAKGDPAGSAGISTSRSVPDSVPRDPRILQPKFGSDSALDRASFGTGGSNTIRNQPPTPPSGGAGTAPTPRPAPSPPSGGLAPVVGTGALDRGGMVAPRGLPAGSNSGTR